MTSSDHRFPDAARLRSNLEFRRVFDQGRSVADGRLVLYAATNPQGTTRLGLSVSRKVGNAVVRNRWKRRLRESFRLNRARLPEGFDLVVIPRAGDIPSMEALSESLVKLAAQAQRRQRKSSR